MKKPVYPSFGVNHRLCAQGRRRARHHQVCADLQAFRLSRDTAAPMQPYMCT
uniref:Uncharacterized protein n=1 Tax=Arundo donax TaxID=35708 RepID=A0A0A9GQJ5_ARUDO